MNWKTDLNSSLTARYKGETESRRKHGGKVKTQRPDPKFRILLSGSYKNEKTGKKRVKQTKVVKQMLKENVLKFRK